MRVSKWYHEIRNSFKNSRSTLVWSKIPSIKLKIIIFRYLNSTFKYLSSISQLYAWRLDLSKTLRPLDFWPWSLFSKTFKFLHISEKGLIWTYRGSLFIIARVACEPIGCEEKITPRMFFAFKFHQTSLIVPSSDSLGLHLILFFFLQESYECMNYRWLRLLI